MGVGGFPARGGNGGVLAGSWHGGCSGGQKMEVFPARGFQREVGGFPVTFQRRVRVGSDGQKGEATVGTKKKVESDSSPV